MNKSSISVVIIAKNEQERIADCLDSVMFADEVILVDTGSSDMTADIASRMGAQVIKYSKGSYDAWRNKGLSMSSMDWILYVDADERVTKELRNEIFEEILNTQFQISKIGGYAIPRSNIILGQEMKHGGEWPDYQKRLFARSKLTGWKGKVHEWPEYEGDLGYMQSPLQHLKHDKISQMVAKTNWWSEIEAGLMMEAKHPPMNVVRFFTAGFREFWLRVVKYQGYRDGHKGFIYAMYQVWSRLVSYAKLWELQLGEVTRNK